MHCYVCHSFGNLCSTKITSFQYKTQYAKRHHNILLKCSTVPVDRRRLTSFPFPLLEKRENDEVWNLNSTAITEFLQHYQHSPVLFSRCFPDLFFAITPEELAGLACESGFVSRVVQHFPTKEVGKQWKVFWGPFSEKYFESFPKKNATLLVHDVERYFPQVEQLLRYFRFISNYRIDDVMLSYATYGGGVGPHIDNYDVFLIQARGRRKWLLHLSPLKKDEEDWLPNQELRVLRSIPSSMNVECILEPGDMLYLPARCPHWGISLDNDCMTYSVGLRLPSMQNMLFAMMEHYTEQFPLEETFLDKCLPSYTAADDPGRIRQLSTIRTHLLKEIRYLLSDKLNFRSFLGKLLTTPIRLDMTQLTEQEEEESEEKAENLARGFWSGIVVLERTKGCKAAYIASSKEVPCMLFVDGTEYRLPKGKLFDQFAKMFCDKQIPLIRCRKLIGFQQHSDFIGLFKSLLLNRSLEHLTQ
ncbi:uncharacterized protein Gasu_48670 [Galdieria sulphuraria]|uniref:Bifunctional lysine-specific demethylase and histidyl-hydroxylase n=1 Tax=Galdieria sulphuraria TaxID=130081 RepID=M2XCC2_GALSU|nr:uncharacterized protein Gasu_48670 [Galdieria sulphuraria]EME27572.1 hypothetical protein Gasu_48670 [Galdieria sulphuraria]|eukprot:XP_005704092.1 hypothetical protein Gasu_48670 [Galdieria sulphuraria]